MRIAVLADIHGNLAALEAVVDDLTRRGVDAVVNLGDSLSGPLLPLETAHFLMAQEWVHIAGNHERQMLTHDPAEWGPSDAYAHSQLSARELGWMASLDSTSRIGDDVLLCHGTPRSDSEYCLETVEPAGVRMATAQEVEDRLSGASDRRRGVRPHPRPAVHALRPRPAHRQPRKRRRARLRRHRADPPRHRDGLARRAVRHHRAPRHEPGRPRSSPCPTTTARWPASPACATAPTGNERSSPAP